MILKKPGLAEDDALNLSVVSKLLERSVASNYWAIWTIIIFYLRINRLTGLTTPPNQQQWRSFQIFWCRFIMVTSPHLLYSTARRPSTLRITTSYLACSANCSAWMIQLVYHGSHLIYEVDYNAFDMVAFSRNIKLSITVSHRDRTTRSNMKSSFHSSSSST